MLSLKRGSVSGHGHRRVFARIAPRLVIRRDLACDPRFVGTQGREAAMTADSQAHSFSADQDLVLRAVRLAARYRRQERQAERALLQATEDLTLCCAAAWERLRQNGTTAEQLYADLRKARFLLHEVQDRNEILGEHLADREPRRRHRYSPSLRFRILEHMHLHLLSVEDTASRFYVTTQTIYNWRAELRERPDTKTIGSLVKPNPPLRRFHDVVRRLCRQMKKLGFGGKRKIAEILLRHGWKVSPRSVGRFIKEKPRETTPPPVETKVRPTTVRGDYPNHLCLIDITQVPLVFKFICFHVAAVLDAYSRLPLAVSFSLFEPSAAAMVALLKRAIKTHGRPQHLVVDRGPQFTAGEFRGFVEEQGILMRYGAVGQFHSIGLIDRFFRTLKESLRPFRPWNVWELKRRLNLALVHYSYVRPHASLNVPPAQPGLTPIEVYYGIRGHLPRPVPPPLGRAGAPGPEIPFDYVFLDPDRRAFPVLVPKAA
jgi:transposase InsO family protein